MQKMTGLNIRRRSQGPRDFKQPETRCKDPLYCLKRKSMLEGFCFRIRDFELINGGGTNESAEKEHGSPIPTVGLTLYPPPRLGYAVDFAAALLIKDRDFLYQEYVVLGKSTKQIAREQGCAASTVSKYLYDFGFPPRSTGLPHQRKGQIPYGSRMVKGRLVEHKGEQAVIAQLIELRKQGKSYGDLVAWLDINQIRTKSKAAKWDRPTVYKIIKRAFGSAVS